MELSDLLRMGASLIQGNDDDATTGLDLESISDALGGLLGGENGLDLSSMMGNLTRGGLGEIVGSWLGDGENASILPEQVTELLGSDKVSEFASKLGLSEESASKALADALPQVIDQASSGEDSLLGGLLDQVGGLDGAMDMAKKFFG